MPFDPGEDGARALGLARLDELPHLLDEVAVLHRLAF
ncbi:hypothetical protein VDGD_20351 [Verticillium dahliae]|nr:hypothetical protein VDGD_20351 [Verticillium dahliae]